MAETIINKNQLPNSIWTPDNLIAGTNISIAEVQQPIIDSNTLALWHYDTNFSNSISGSAFTDINSRYTAFSSAGSISTSYHKFGDGSAQGWAQDNYYCVFTSSNNGIGTGDFTVDFWYYLNGSGSWFMLQNVIYSGNMFWCKPLVDGKYEIQQDGGSTISVDNTTGWHHYAIERYQGSVNFYLDGNKVATFTNNSNVDGLTMPFLGTGSTQALDELRISNVARYQGQNFTPFNQPYSTASGESQYAINADLSSKQDILTSATGYDDTKTQVLKNVNGTITWVTES